MATYTFTHLRRPKPSPSPGKLVQELSIEADDDLSAIQQAESHHAELMPGTDFVVLLKDPKGELVWEMDLSNA